MGQKQEPSASDLHGLLHGALPDLPQAAQHTQEGAFAAPAFPHDDEPWLALQTDDNYNGCIGIRMDDFFNITTGVFEDTSDDFDITTDGSEIKTGVFRDLQRIV